MGNYGFNASTQKVSRAKVDPKRSHGAQKMDVKHMLRCTKDWKSPKIGDGTFLGHLYKAVDGDSAFAILKVTNKKLLETMDEVAVRNLGKISHPNIASLRGYVFGADTSDIAVFIYESGSGNLRTHLNDNFLAISLLWKSRVEVVQGLLRAVHYLHSKLKLCHRFVQPANIFLLPEGRERRECDCSLMSFLDDFSNIQIKSAQ